MKLYLASFLQKENFGPGRVISVTDSNKPNGIKVPFIFRPLAPSKELISRYNKSRINEPEDASRLFVSSYKRQLDDFYDQAVSDATDEGITLMQLLPFEEGDTLASWERFGFQNYRDMLADLLRKIGYEVNLR